MLSKPETAQFSIYEFQRDYQSYHCGGLSDYRSAGMVLCVEIWQSCLLSSVLIGSREHPWMLLLQQASRCTAHPSPPATQVLPRSTPETLVIGADVEWHKHWELWNRGRNEWRFARRDSLFNIASVYYFDIPSLL